ncbi:MAG: DMT family transporter [Bacteriovoracaceae bacterium]|nr:DMT family transporter [Bacteriovoracaceae bacterium]
MNKGQILIDKVVKKITSKLSTGALLSLLAAFTFSVMNMMTKEAAARLPSSEIVFFRSLFSAIIVFFIMIKGKHSFKGHNVPLLVLRGVLGGVGLLGVFYTIAHIKLADASILLQLNPLFVIIFAAFFLKETIPRNYFILLILSLIGCALIIKPGLDGVNSFAATVGVVSAILAAGAYTCIRALGKKNNTYIIVLYFVVIAMIVSAPVMAPVFIFPNLKEWPLLIGIGASSALAQLFLTKAYRLEKAGIVSIVSYTGIMFHILWGYLLWGETMDLYSTIGGFLIVASCLTLSVRKLK